MARILIAEDEEGLRTLVARALALDGHEVITANDGAEALEVLTRTDGAFELLLTDIRMPVMDGIALALAAARDHPRLGILLMTGYADQRERASGLDALIHDVIAKPFSLGTIRGAVNDALGAKAPAGRCTERSSVCVWSERSARSDFFHNGALGRVAPPDQIVPAVGRTITSFTSTSSGCSTAKAMARAMASGVSAYLGRGGLELLGTRMRNVVADSGLATTPRARWS